MKNEAHWHIAALEDVAEIQTGLSKSAGRQGESIRLPYLRVANVQDGHFDLSEVKEIEVPNIPINKWVNVIIRCHTTSLDVYVNGTLARSIELSGVPKQNYGNVYVAMNGGFDGYISNLWYYNYALGTAAIQQLVAKGPDTTIAGNDGINVKNSKYLSMRWFFDGQGDSYNPAVIDSVAN